MPLLILLLLLFIVPWLALLIFFFFIVFWLIFIPLGFAGRSIFWLFTGPAQLFKILGNKKVRQNHALEHATVHILEEESGIPQVEGMAYEDGFTIRGLVDPGRVYQAAIQALERLKRGEKDLAIHPKCGTTVLVVNTLSSLLFIIILVLTGNLTILNVIIALVLAHVIGPWSARLVQRYVTTLADIDKDMVVTGVTTKTQSRSGAVIFIGGPAELYVHTGRETDETIPEILD